MKFSIDKIPNATYEAKFVDHGVPMVDPVTMRHIVYDLGWHSWRDYSEGHKRYALWTESGKPAIVFTATPSGETYDLAPLAPYVQFDFAASPTA